MTNLKDNFYSQELLTKTAKLFIIFVLLYAGLIFWTPAHNDDVKRTFAGNQWSYEGRVLATFLYKSLTGTFNLIFLAIPALQITAFLVMAYATVILTKTITGALKWTNIAIFSTLALFPFSNIVFIYKFDSIYFSIAIFLGILPFYLKDQLSYKKWFILTILSLMGVITSYPPALNIYLVLSAYFIALQLKESNFKKVIKQTLFFAIPFISAYVAYVIFRKIGILKFETGYIQKSSTLLTLKEIFGSSKGPSLRFNITTYREKFLVGLSQSTMGLAIRAVISVFYGLLTVKIVKMKAKLWYKVFLLLLSFLTFFIPVVFELFLSYSRFVPRHMIAWNVTFGIMLFVINGWCQRKWLKRLAFLATGYTLMLFAIFPSIFSSASRQQAIYNNSVKQSILTNMALYEHDTQQKIKTMMIEGSVPYAPDVRNMLSYYPQLKLTVIPQPAPHSWFKEYLFQDTYRADAVKVAYAKFDVPKKILAKERILYKKGALYDFYSIDDTTIYIKFRSPAIKLTEANFFNSFKTKLKKVLGR